MHSLFDQHTMYPLFLVERSKKNPAGIMITLHAFEIQSRELELDVITLMSTE